MMMTSFHIYNFNDIDNKRVFSQSIVVTKVIVEFFVFEYRKMLFFTKV